MYSSKVIIIRIVHPDSPMWLDVSTAAALGTAASRRAGRGLLRHQSFRFLSWVLVTRE